MIAKRAGLGVRCYLAILCGRSSSRPCRRRSTRSTRWGHGIREAHQVSELDEIEHEIDQVLRSQRS